MNIKLSEHFDDSYKLSFMFIDEDFYNLFTGISLKRKNYKDESLGEWYSKMIPENISNYKEKKYLWMILILEKHLLMI